MTTLATVEKLALELPEQQRIALHILDSLPALFSEDDGGLTEAQRRDSELDSNPSIAFSLAELDQKISDRHPRWPSSSTRASFPKST